MQTVVIWSQSRARESPGGLGAHRIRHYCAMSGKEADAKGAVCSAESELLPFKSILDIDT